jgi:xylose isomerase
LVQAIEEGTATLEDCEAFILQHGEPKQTSGKQEKFESIFVTYV